ncbi:uncharacterized protein LOC128558527 [Mercenaria mercenaria]|uniref:uncharacterized protein LOC128558527 n=1 Tax=Mercenaria mercenaria TaxID=6596 RepID=UPI00234E4F6A|nr:uncharacterized protein LOC128558527 [Mercenaria mercenaria]
MIGISVSNDGTHFGAQQTVVILDTTCQQTQKNADNETIVTLKTGFCYIAATCYSSGTYLTGSSCAKCDTAQNLFVWTDGCNETDDTNKNNLIIIMSSVGGAILAIAVALAVIIYLKIKAKKKRTLAPLVETSLGPSKMRFWFRKGSDVAVVEHHLGRTKGRKMAAEYISDGDEEMG